MKAITVRQPWAWAIASGEKLVENRSRGTTYRGPLAIHAGAAWSVRGEQDPRVKALPVVRPWSPTTRSAVIAVAELVDSHPDAQCCRPWGESEYSEAGGRTIATVHHLVLEDVRPLAVPLAAGGALGLWTVPDRIATALEEIPAP